MFGHSYFGASYYGPSYFGPSSGEVGPSSYWRRYNQKNRPSIDWSIPFVVQKEELKTLDQQIQAIKEEITETKKEVDYTSSIYALNAISNRIDELVEKLKKLLEQREILQVTLHRKPKVVRESPAEILRKQAEQTIRKALLKKIEVEDVLKALDKVDEFDELDEKDYDVVYIYKLLKRKR